jgi:hypothetical protein
VHKWNRGRLRARCLTRPQSFALEVKDISWTFSWSRCLGQTSIWFRYLTAEMKAKRALTIQDD